MMKPLLVAACALFMASPALACAHESPDSVHRREIYILGLGIQTSKRDAGVIAKAQELRAILVSSCLLKSPSKKFMSFYKAVAT
jgi:hypothetical protein